MTGYRGPNVTIYPHVEIGEDVHIEAGAVIGRMPISNGNKNHELPAGPLPTKIGAGSIIGANSVIYAGATIGERVLICDLVRIREDVEIGDLAVIGAGVTIDWGCRVGARTRIMDQTHLANCTIVEEDVFLSLMVMTAADQNIYLSRFGITETDFQPAVIRRKALLGAGACVLPGAIIGEGAILGAGAVAVDDVPPYTIALGIPARVVRPVDEVSRRLVESETWLKIPQHA